MNESVLGKRGKKGILRERGPGAAEGCTGTTAILEEWRGKNAGMNMGRKGCWKGQWEA